MNKKITFNILLVLFAVTIGFTACKKDNSGSSSPFFGRWEERRSSGGFRGDSTYQPGNGNIYQFNTDSTFKQFSGGKVIASGAFHIRTDSRSGQNFEGFLRLNNDIYGNYISLSNNMLTIGTAAADGIAVEYAKPGGR